MKLHSTSTQQFQTITGYDDAGVEINAVRYASSVIVVPEDAPIAWNVHSIDGLTAADFDKFVEIHPDVVIVGTGNRQRFIYPKLIAVLAHARIGIECMDNKAACRTYNILMGEGRKVALGLIIESANLAPNSPLAGEAT